MSQQLINRSPDLKRLRDDGFNIEIRAGYLLTHEIPYVNAQKEVKRGILVSKLDLAGNVTARPENHVAQFIGDYPCNADGSQIVKIFNATNNQELAPGLTVNHVFSAKPKPSDHYDDYYSKVTTYVAILAGPAQVLSPGITAKNFTPVPAVVEDDGVFNYIDTSSSRAEIDLVNEKLKLNKIAIIGLGGSGSYVLDFVSKTRVKEIHLFDRDDFLQHNAFRSPGAASLEELNAKPRKVAYLKAIYSKLRRGIVAHEANIGAENIHELRDINFVFICMDKGEIKKLIVEKLEEYGIPFIDVGMGIYKGEEGLGGALRVTTSTAAQRNARNRISFSDGNGNNEYANNIQVTELNALNAALAVIKWKKLFGFYLDYEREHQSVYTIELHTLSREDQRA